MPTHLSLIRHGETPWNTNGRWQGHARIPLNDEGKRQAALLAEHLAPNAEITAIYTSDSLRTQQTADILAARLDKPVYPDDRLREIDMGEWQGLTREEIIEWDSERWTHIMSDPRRIPRPGGESGDQVSIRSIAALEEIIVRHRDEHVLVVTHGGTINNLLATLNLLQPEHGHIGNTSLTRLLHQHDNETAPWSLDVFNLLTHLDESKVRDNQEG